MYEFTTRDIPGRSLLYLKRNVDWEHGALGGRQGVRGPAQEASTSTHGGKGRGCYLASTGAR